MLKTLLVVGTRPEAIKMGPVVRALAQNSDSVSFKVCLTSQHRELATQALHLFDIPVHYDLGVMTRDQSPTQVAAAVLDRIEPVLKRERPDWILVQGDTTSAAAAAMAAFYAGVRIGHVEAGLRTHDRHRPFPEEMHRRMAAIMADLHFAPTARARRALIREGVPEDDIVLTGNPVVDALEWVSSLPFDCARLPLQGRPPHSKILLVTAHRRESFGGPMEEICGAIRDLAVQYGDEVLIVFPVHRNPNVSEPVGRILGAIPNVRLTPPLDYIDFVHLLKQAYLVLTDSGGVQEEAPSFGVPVLILRDLTERPENIEAGAARIVGCDRDNIVRAAEQLIENPVEYRAMSTAPNPFGDGRAGERIVGALLHRAYGLRGSDGPQRPRSVKREVVV
jgi:UDP-N-acetylglucosamine 2-epimerase (non-hydrolysing)